jgi:uroporphyrinogen decarboxylase
MKSLVKILRQERAEKIPVWFMRQAGRYLPEYRELRSQAGSFLEAVFTPELAAEITLQPIRRFDLDGAIVFSDILVLPYALGVDLDFKEGLGPVVNFPFNPKAPLDSFLPLTDPSFNERLEKVCQTLRITKANLARNKPDVSLIGFAGAPWTVLCYLLEGTNRGKGDYDTTRALAYQYPEAFQSLLDYLTEATILFLAKQIEAGAEVIKLFDSHAGVLGEEEFRNYVLRPLEIISSFFMRCYSSIPLIAYPRGSGRNYELCLKTDISCLALDHLLPLDWVKEKLQTRLPVQGGLDNIPLILDSKGARDTISSQVDTLLMKLVRPHSESFIFNLGRGCLPGTKIENLQLVIDKVRNFEKKSGLFL